MEATGKIGKKLQELGAFVLAGAKDPHQLHGRSLFYSTAIGTDSRFADVIVEQATAFDQRKQVFQSAS